jgi:hypothetical protein
MKSVQTYFPRFQNRDDGASDASVCILCTESQLKDSEKKFWKHCVHELQCVLHY